MARKTILAVFVLLLLSSCIKISASASTSIPARFVTATLPPTKPGLREPTQILPTGSPTLPTSNMQSTSACKDSAVLLADVSYPDNTRLETGEMFTKTWKIQNTGTCTWTGYTAAFLSGDKMEAPDSIPVAETQPKSMVELSIDLVAPAKAGAFTGIFELRNASGNVVPIGTEKSFWVKIVVGNGVSPTSGSVNIVATINPVKLSQCQYSENSGYTQQLIALINQARAGAQLSTLTVSAVLTTAAQAHSVDMACGNYLGHNGPNGEPIGYRLRESGYASAGFQEIIAIGTPQDAMNQWRNDSGHWEIVLNPYTQAIGVGYAYSASSDLGGYFTVDFGSP